MVQIDEKPTSAGRASVAAALAARSKAQLSGVFLKADFLRSYVAAEALTYMAPADIDALLKEHAAAVEKASEAGRAMFEAAAGEAGVVSDWRLIDGDRADDLVACARRTDLTVLAPHARAGLGNYPIPASSVGLASGGPVLVVPEGHSGGVVGKRCLVAWKGTRESARALRDAWPLLQTAQSVTVPIVSPKGDDGPDGLLQRHLEHHRCKANVIVDRSDDASAGQVLRRQIAALDIDLLVMGLYGRTRVSELLLGGVSRDLLNAPPVCVLAAH
jgi:nucleotide-binding universal stress UspA family protein